MRLHNFALARSIVKGLEERLYVGIHATGVSEDRDGDFFQKAERLNCGFGGWCSWIV